MTNETHPELDELTPRLLEALLLSGMSTTAFSYHHFGDPAFIKKAKDGRKFRRATAAKIEAILKEYGV